MKKALDFALRETNHILPESPPHQVSGLPSVEHVQGIRGSLQYASLTCDSVMRSTTRADTIGTTPPPALNKLPRITSLLDSGGHRTPSARSDGTGDEAAGRPRICLAPSPDQGASPFSKEALHFSMCADDDGPAVLPSDIEGMYKFDAPHGTMCPTMEAVGSIASARPDSSGDVTASSVSEQTQSHVNGIGFPSVELVGRPFHKIGVPADTSGIRLTGKHSTAAVQVEPSSCASLVRTSLAAACKHASPDYSYVSDELKLGSVHVSSQQLRGAVMVGGGPADRPQAQLSLNERHGSGSTIEDTPVNNLPLAEFGIDCSPRADGGELRGDMLRSTENFAIGSSSVLHQSSCKGHHPGSFAATDPFCSSSDMQQRFSVSEHMAVGERSKQSGGGLECRGGGRRGAGGGGENVAGARECETVRTAPVTRGVRRWAKSVASVQRDSADAKDDTTSKLCLDVSTVAERFLTQQHFDKEPCPSIGVASNCASALQRQEGEPVLAPAGSCSRQRTCSSLAAGISRSAGGVCSTSTVSTNNASNAAGASCAPAATREVASPCRARVPLPAPVEFAAVHGQAALSAVDSTGFNSHVLQAVGPHSSSGGTSCSIDAVADGNADVRPADEASTILTLKGRCQKLEDELVLAQKALAGQQGGAPVSPPPPSAPPAQAPSPAYPSKGKGKGGKGKGKVVLPPIPSPPPQSPFPKAEQPTQSGGKARGKPPPPGKAPPKAKATVGAGASKAKVSPRKVEIKPRTPMKRLFWNSFILDETTLDIPRQTVWGAIHKDGNDRVDIEELERMFGEHQSGNRPRLFQEASTKKRARARARVFEESRRRQVCVMLARLPSSDETVAAVAEMDDVRLNKDQVELLLANAPSAEELAALRSAVAEMEHNTEEPLNWDDAEAFILKLSAVPSFALRLQIWAFENSFDERFELFQSAATDVRVACGLLQDSPGIQRLLSLALYIGNYLNAGTSRGRADGFTAEALAQMRVMKTSQPGPVVTLVDFIVRQLELARPGELDSLFLEDGVAQSVRKASRQKLPDLTMELSAYCAQAEGLIKRTSSLQDDELGIRGQRVEQRLQELLELQRLYETAEEEYCRLCVWLHECSAARGTRRPADELFCFWDGFLEAVRVALESIYRGRTRRRKTLGMAKTRRPLQKLKRSFSLGDDGGGPNPQAGGTQQQKQTESLSLPSAAFGVGMLPPHKEEDENDQQEEEEQEEEEAEDPAAIRPHNLIRRASV